MGTVAGTNAEPSSESDTSDDVQVTQIDSAPAEIDAPAELIPTRTSVREAFRRVLIENLQRVVTAEVKTLRRLSKEKLDIREIERFYETFPAKAKTMLGALFEATCATFGRVHAESFRDETIRRYVADSRKSLLEIFTASEWGERLEEYLSDFEIHRAEREAEAILGELDENGTEKRRAAA
jgi:hypothetical protein